MAEQNLIHVKARFEKPAEYPKLFPGTGGVRNRRGQVQTIDKCACNYLKVQDC